MIGTGGPDSRIRCSRGRSKGLAGLARRVRSHISAVLRSPASDANSSILLRVERRHHRGARNNAFESPACPGTPRRWGDLVAIIGTFAVPGTGSEAIGPDDDR